MRNLTCVLIVAATMAFPLKAQANAAADVENPCLALVNPPAIQNYRAYNAYSIEDPERLDAAISACAEATLVNHDVPYYSYLYGLILKLKGVFDVAVIQMERAAEVGYAPAQFMLGAMYDMGNAALPEDNDMALYWYRLAAEQNVILAQYELGKQYATGDGVEVDRQAASYWYQLAAEQGHVDAQVALGFLLKANRTTAADSVKWFQSAATRGHAEANAALGIAYLQGEGVKKDLEEAAVRLTVSARKGIKLAQFYLGLMHVNGQGVGKNARLASELLQQAIAEPLSSDKLPLENSQIVEAQATIGALYYLGGLDLDRDYASAKFWLDKAAKQSDPAAQYYLGLLYFRGLATAPNEERAFSLFKSAAVQGHRAAIDMLKLISQIYTGFDNVIDQASRASFQQLTRVKDLFRQAEAGNSAAQFILASGYHYGFYERGTHMTSAAKWYRRAAKNGNLHAQYQLGTLYMEGATSIPQNTKLAYYWTKEASMLGHPLAQARLAYFYINGLGVQKDYQMAFQWSRKAADNGNAEGYYFTAMLYKYGLGQPVNNKAAFQYFYRGATRQHLDSQIAVAEMYRRGLHGVVDPEKAFYWYEKAAHQQDAYAETKLAESYLQGNGTTKNPDRAQEYFQRACQRGHAPACQQLETLMLAQ